MVEDQTTVDVISLEDFHATLDARVSEASSALNGLRATLGRKQPSLGGFEDAVTTGERYRQLHSGQLDRAGRLLGALTAARTATAQIISNYRTTEARNAASATDISAALQPVGEVLDGEPGA